MQRGYVGFPFPTGTSTPVPIAGGVTTLGAAPGFLGTFGGGRYQVFYSSGTFTAPISGQYRVRVLGAGASGAAVTATAQAAATGGSGPGFAMSILQLSANQSITVTVGVGGAAVASSGVVNGNSGGTSSFGPYLSATGGTGGVASTAVSGTLVGPSGGIGIGGNVINAKGGSAGSILLGAGTFAATGGGGAGSQLGDGGPSGSITYVGSTPTCTGGGSVASSFSASLSTSGTSGGAGVGGPSMLSVGGPDIYGVTSSGPTVAGAVNTGNIPCRFPGDVFTSGGSGSGVLNGAGATGGLFGGASGALTGSSSVCITGNSGNFAGTGAVLNPTAGGDSAISGDGGIGGSTGGAIGGSGGALSKSGKAGNGLVIVEW